MTNLTKKELITLIYASEDNTLAEKVIDIFLDQQKKVWENEVEEADNLILRTVDRDGRVTISKRAAHEEGTPCMVKGYMSITNAPVDVNNHLSTVYPT